MNTILSQKMHNQASGELKVEAENYIDSAFDYTRNDQLYRITFLEFGATGCVACKRMEKVMEEVRAGYPRTVQVRFINVLLPENQVLMKYYGIASIPSQVLLDSTGREYFRHSGYFSFKELKEKFKPID